MVLELLFDIKKQAKKDVASNDNQWCQHKTRGEQATSLVVDSKMLTDLLDMPDFFLQKWHCLSAILIQNKAFRYKILSKWMKLE